MAITDQERDLDLIVPPESSVVVAGHECRVKRLKSREFLALVGIVTRGIGPGLANIRLTGDEAAQQLAGLLVLAIPNAVDEFIGFLMKIVEPVDPTREKDVREALVNPELELLLDLAGVIALQEKDDLQVLVGKAQAIWEKVVPNSPQATG